MAAVLFQFPAWVLPNDRTLDHIDACIERMSGFQLATGFRRDLWFDESNRLSTLDVECERALVHVVVDAPPGQAKAVSAVWEVTKTTLAIRRLHGRNVETWEKKYVNVASAASTTTTSKQSWKRRCPASLG